VLLALVIVLEEDLTFYLEIIPILEIFKFGLLVMYQNGNGTG